MSKSYKDEQKEVKIMDLKNYSTGVQHIGIPTNDIDKTVVRDIEEIFRYINEAGLNSTQDTIHFLPFWENGVKFFTIEGPNKEKVEFGQYL